MNFKKPKNEVVEDARLAAKYAFETEFMRQQPFGTVFNHGSLSYTLGEAVSSAMAEAIRSIVDDMYTDQEFEEDIGLIDKT